MIKADESVLKTDGLGRVKTPVARREQLLEEFERSGLSGIKYAALVGRWTASEPSTARTPGDRQAERLEFRGIPGDSASFPAFSAGGICMETHSTLCLMGKSACVK
jgi:hypothetical protein